MIIKLIRGKIIQKYKIREKYYHVIVDGTGLATSRKKYNENEGFNIQKNGTFDIGHVYSKNQTAIKGNYLMIQIAHILRLLLEKI